MGKVILRKEQLETVVKDELLKLLKDESLIIQLAKQIAQRIMQEEKQLLTEKQNEDEKN